MSKFTITKTKKLILAAMFLSILLVLSRFLSIKTSFLVISFSFIPMMLCGVYLGPKYSLAVAALGDLIGALIFPFGAYFPGFTITAGLMGFIYGIFLYKNPNKEISQNNENDKTNIKTKNKDINIPSVICKKCKSNIFEVGYIVCENKIFKFSPEENKPVEIAKEDLNSVICCNCNSLIENTTPKDLEALCNITTCINCKNDLRSTGIIDKRNLIYNKDSNKFDLGETYYACGKCEKAISDQQKDYFKLK